MPAHGPARDEALSPERGKSRLSWTATTNNWRPVEASGVDGPSLTATLSGVTGALKGSTPRTMEQLRNYGERNRLLRQHVRDHCLAVPGSCRCCNHLGAGPLIHAAGRSAPSGRVPAPHQPRRARLYRVHEAEDILLPGAGAMGTSRFGSRMAPLTAGTRFQQARRSGETIRA